MSSSFAVIPSCGPPSSVPVQLSGCRVCHPERMCVAGRRETRVIPEELARELRRGRHRRRSHPRLAPGREVAWPLATSPSAVHLPAAAQHLVYLSPPRVNPKHAIHDVSRCRAGGALDWSASSIRLRLVRHTGSELRGRLAVAGSRRTFPSARACARDFQRWQPGTRGRGPHVRGRLVHGERSRRAHLGSVRFTASDQRHRRSG